MRSRLAEFACVECRAERRENDVVDVPDRVESGRTRVCRRHNAAMRFVGWCEPGEYAP